VRPRPGQGKGLLRERASGGSKASKRACRPFTGEPDANERVGREGARKRVKPAGLAITGNRRSRLMRRARASGCAFGKELARRRK